MRDDEDDHSNQTHKSNSFFANRYHDTMETPYRLTPKLFKVSNIYWQFEQDELALDGKSFEVRATQINTAR